ncbi:hypothetical protein SAMN05660880_04103 [Luteibacter sp. 22Crub2.1]|nr:hypothetical protein SAMN05660880_04103 [Luteibacter sp. 22Crub2.1]
MRKSCTRSVRGCANNCVGLFSTLGLWPLLVQVHLARLLQASAQGLKALLTSTQTETSLPQRARAWLQCFRTRAFASIGTTDDISNMVLQALRAISAPITRLRKLRLLKEFQQGEAESTETYESPATDNHAIFERCSLGTVRTRHSRRRQSRLYTSNATGVPVLPGERSTPGPNFPICSSWPLGASMGAVAVAPSGRAGIVTGAVSKWSAEQEALQRCSCRLPVN